MTIGIVTKPGLADAGDTLLALEHWLGTRRVSVVWSDAAAALLPPAAERWVVSADDLPRAVDLVLVLGGDGTLLGMAGRIAAANVDIPLLGVNFGSLGFLTEITRPELFTSLETVIAGSATHDERMLLRARSLGAAMATHVARNDIVFSRPSGARLLELGVWVGDQFVTTIRADGLIVASPTGSTAYNLSAGGPIVHPAMDALVLTPIAPHTLSNRPIVIPAERDVRVQMTSRAPEDGMLVTFDGQITIDVPSGTDIVVGRAPRPLRLIRASARSYFDVLREKLGWHQR
jgi:NAD+ kinase